MKAELAFNSSKHLPKLILISTVILFLFSLVRGNYLVRKSENELSPTKQLDEAQATSYSLREIDAKTGQLRWKLTAKEGKTEDNLQAALIKDITAEVYKNEIPVFNLSAPYGKANAQTKGIYLFGNVIAKDNDGNFLLMSNQIALGMGTSIEAQKGFNLVLKNSGTIVGESALINDEQTKLTISKLKEASFKNILLSGEKVYLEKDKNGDLTRAVISEGGKVILKKDGNDSLSANEIIWKKDGEIEAKDNVTYISKDKTFKAGYILLKPDKRFYAKQNVLITHGETKCYGNALSYENDSLIILTGRPKAIQNGKQIIADKIVYDLNTEKVEATGNVKTSVRNISAKPQ